VGSYIDNVRCGKCDARLMLEPGIVTVQNYRGEPAVRHFWIYCSFCDAEKLYWPTMHQIVLADVLDCAWRTDEDLPDDVLASYQEDSKLPPDRVRRLGPPTTEIAFLLNMLAATSGDHPPASPPLASPPLASPPQSYLPPSWSN
jgi:hypothetical protein